MNLLSKHAAFEISKHIETSLFFNQIYVDVIDIIKYLKRTTQRYK